MTESVLIVGGTGRLGSRIATLLHGRDVPVRILSRNAGRTDLHTLPDVERVSGDIRDPRTLPPAAFEQLSGLIISVEPGIAASGPDSPEATMYQGVRNVLSAVAKAGSRPHVVLVSQIYVTRSRHPMNSRGRLLDWRLRGEEEVRRSGLDYTVIRPSWLTHGHPTGEAVRLEQGDTGDGQISISDVADACVHALFEPAASHKTFELYNTAGQPPAWPELLGTLRADAPSLASAS